MGLEQVPNDGSSSSSSGGASTGDGGNGVSAMAMVFELSLTVLLPLVVGQLLKVWLNLVKGPPSWIGNLVLVLIIWASFCDLWISDIQVTVAALGFMAVCVVVFQVRLMR
jgi:predicted Na+-dependent transporter